MAAEARYQEIPPPPALRPFVRTLWTYTAPDDPGAVQRIAPDGCPELVFDLGAPHEERDLDGRFAAQPAILFAGQMTRPLEIRALGPVEPVSVRFEPDGARDFLGLPLVLATDRRLDLRERCAGLELPAGDPVRQAQILIDWLEAQRRAGDWRLDPAVRAAVETGGEPPAAGPATARRTLQRRFLDRVGVAPRMLRSILRFRRVFDHAARPDAEAASWLEAGLTAGYFDQPQMARDFRRFLGCTATAWARDQAGLARSLASQTYKTASADPA